MNYQNNGVVIIIFNRVDVMNALNVGLMTAFARTIDELQSNQDAKVVIITGAGKKAFSSGGDLSELRHQLGEDDARHFTRIMVDALAMMENLPIPVIAAVNGYALGGGSEIALACDMRIVDEQVKMGFVQINMALTPGWGAGQRLLRLVGYSKAMELLLKGEILRADDLLALGLANQKVVTGTSFQSALEFANQIAERPPKAVRGIKKLLRAGLTSPYDEARDTEFEIFPELWADEAHIAAVENYFLHQAIKREKRD